ncbi:MAG: hypothetical protein N2596_01465 [Syntrophorhabdaceae bacterium]|nr:hypothetical protein [Syntrophorhabdaceae bacterium]
MTPDELRYEIELEYDYLDQIVKELSQLLEDIGDRQPTVREKTAAAAFLAQFYNGVENILKRICHYYKIPLPTGDSWHIELFKRFCVPPYGPLPLLFNSDLAPDMATLRKFRHVVHHGYGFQLDWERLKEGMINIEEVFRRFKMSCNNFLNNL